MDLKEIFYLVSFIVFILVSIGLSTGNIVIRSSQDGDTSSTTTTTTTSSITKRFTIHTDETTEGSVTPGFAFIFTFTAFIGLFILNRRRAK